MKNILIVFLIIALSSGTSSNSILYERVSKLTWSDFKAKPPKSTKYSANTSSGYALSMALNGNVVDVILNCAFHKNESWVKKGKENESLLNHEQRHFDLTELYCRKMRKEIFSLKTSADKVNQKISEIVKSNSKLLDEAQNLYDKETNHNLIAEKQKEWNDYIDEELRKYDSFSSSKVSLLLIK